VDILEAEGESGQGQRQQNQLRILPTSKKLRRRAGRATTGSRRTGGCSAWL